MKKREPKWTSEAVELFVSGVMESADEITRTDTSGVHAIITLCCGLAYKLGSESGLTYECIEEAAQISQMVHEHSVGKAMVILMMALAPMPGTLLTMSPNWSEKIYAAVYGEEELERVKDIDSTIERVDDTQEDHSDSSMDTDADQE